MPGLHQARGNRSHMAGEVVLRPPLNSNRRLLTAEGKEQEAARYHSARVRLSPRAGSWPKMQNCPATVTTLNEFTGRTNLRSDPSHGIRQVLPGAQSRRCPEAHHEANRCNLGHVTPKTLQKALYVGSYQIGRPLQVVCLGRSQFPIPEARLAGQAGPIYGLTYGDPCYRITSRDSVLAFRANAAKTVCTTSRAETLEGDKQSLVSAEPVTPPSVRRAHPPRCRFSPGNNRSHPHKT
jgi:hypothetical protein